MKKIYAALAACMTVGFLAAQPAGWSYVLPVSATNNTATQVIGYQLRLVYDTQTPIGLGRMNANGDDIRFGKDCAGATLLNYWIESGINTPSTVIWVKLDTLPANGTVNFFMYYGNAAATATSAVNGTFIGPHSSTDSVASGGAGGVGNSQRGFRFSPNEDVLMTHVGKREPTGTTRTVTLFDFTTQAIITQQTVGGPAGQYSYNPLTTPVWLTQGTQYLLELYQGASDGYYFGTSSQIGQHLTYYDMRYCNSCTANTFPTNTLTNYQYGYPDMWYYTKLTVAVAPTVTFGSGVLAVTNSGPATICAGDSVSISVTASGGVAPYSYNWLPAAGVGSPTSATTMVSPSASVTYTCTIFDGCSSGILDSIVVTVNALPIVTANVSTDSVCPGSGFVPTGGGASTYAWTGGLSDNVYFTPSVTDTYTVTGTDVNGCSATASVTVEILVPPTVTASVSSTAVCAGDSVTFNGSGAATYSWDNGVTENVPYVPSGTMMYHVTGMDLFGCTNTDSIAVTVNPIPDAITSVSGSPFCAGAGSAVLAASGGDTYLWQPGSLTGNNLTVTPSVSTTYTVTATDTTTGCSDTASVQVVVNPNPTVVTTGDTTCVGGCAQLNAIPSGGTPQYTFNWVPSAGLSNPNIANPVACNTVTMCYTVTVVDSNGCIDSQLACAGINQLPVVALTGPSNVCVTDGLYVLTGTPASGTFSGAGVTGNSFSPATAGNGTHMIYYSYTDANGCTGVDSMAVVVSPCVGIAEQNGANGMEVYPNPFNDVLQVNIAEGPSQVRIVNALGEIVFDQQLNKGATEINTSAFAPGVYIIEVNGPLGTSAVKMIKGN